MARSVRNQSSVRPRSAWRLLTGVALLLSSTLSAQSYSLAKVDSLVLRGDSTDALRVADEAIRSDRGSAEAWHRRGMGQVARATLARGSGDSRIDDLIGSLAAELRLDDGDGISGERKVELRQLRVEYLCVSSSALAVVELAK